MPSKNRTINIKTGYSTKEFSIENTGNGYILDIIAYGSWYQSTHNTIKEVFDTIKKFLGRKLDGN